MIQNEVFWTTSSAACFIGALFPSDVSPSFTFEDCSSFDLFSLLFPMVFAARLHTHTVRRGTGNGTLITTGLGAMEWEREKAVFPFFFLSWRGWFACCPFLFLLFLPPQFTLWGASYIVPDVLKGKPCKQKKKSKNNEKSCFFLDPCSHLWARACVCVCVCVHLSDIANSLLTLFLSLPHVRRTRMLHDAAMALSPDKEGPTDLYNCSRVRT